MSIYKYVSENTGIRYLTNWCLRYSPPSALNDPFELKTRIDDKAIHRMDDVLIKVGNEMSSKLGLPEFPDRRSDPNFDPKLRVEEFNRALPLIWEHLGILCFSRTRRHLLMWAHYTNGHHGMLLEFDESHESIAERGIDRDTSGILYNVRYADERPQVADLMSTEQIYQSHSTKSLEWAYEQEVRMFWWLNEPDLEQVVNGERICLLRFPATALKSVTFGCLATPATETAVRAALDAMPEASSVKLHRAKISAAAFALEYYDLTR